jgi:hypothetical protein
MKVSYFNPQAGTWFLEVGAPVCIYPHATSGTCKTPKTILNMENVTKPNIWA